MIVIRMFTYISIHVWSRFFLTFQAGWKESHATFTAELKNLAATGVTSLGNALKSCFDLLNVNRMQSGIDTYGQV